VNLIDVECEWSWLILDGAAVVVVVVAGVTGQLIQTVLEQSAGRSLGVRQTPPVHLLYPRTATVTVPRVRRSQHPAAAADDEDDDADESDVGTTHHRYIVTISGGKCLFPRYRPNRQEILGGEQLLQVLQNYLFSAGLAVKP